MRSSTMNTTFFYDWGDEVRTQSSVFLEDAAFSLFKHGMLSFYV